MKKIWIFAVCCLLSLYSLAQDISITFTATGAATSIDSIIAINLSTNQSVTFPGDGTLVLRKSSGIKDISEVRDRIGVFPNPFSGVSRVVVTINEPQRVNLRIQNMIGQVIAQSNEFLQPGANEFAISVNDNGLYAVVLETQQGFNCCKVECLSTFGQKNKIQYMGVTGVIKDQSITTEVKSYQSGYSLDYVTGDIIHYTCYSGVMTTIITDLVGISKNIKVEFADCTDPDGKHYKIVKIGDQTWMAENLRTTRLKDSTSIPLVTDDNSWKLLTTGAYCFYENNPAFNNDYGALYNWYAVNSGKLAPKGWHIPSLDEWSTLVIYLGGPGTAGSKLKERGMTHWTSPNAEATNSTGFTALPGGYRYLEGQFVNMHTFGYWWISTVYDATNAYFFSVRKHSGIAETLMFNLQSGFSVRCLKD